MDDPSQFRISDDDRHAVAEVLRQAAGEGRIDFEELDERLEATYAAKTFGDLIPITADLPSSNLAVPKSATPARASSGGTLAPRSQTHFAVMSGVNRRGHWIVPERTTVLALMGGANLDLREAEFSAREVTITVNAIMGGAEIVVGTDVNVIVEGVGIMGAFQGPSSRFPAEVTPDSPVVRIKGLALMGGVNVHRRPRKQHRPPALPA
jgi:hypothetical protein